MIKLTPLGLKKLIYNDFRYQIKILHLMFKLKNTFCLNYLSKNTEMNIIPLFYLKKTKNVFTAAGPLGNGYTNS